MATAAELKTFRPDFMDCTANGKSYGQYVTTLAALVKKEGGYQLEQDFWNAGIAIPGLLGAGSLSSFYESMGADYCYSNLTGMFQRMDDWFSRNKDYIPNTNDAFIYTMMENWGQTSQHQKFPEKYLVDPNKPLDEPPKNEVGYKIPTAAKIVASVVVVSLIWALLGPTIKALRKQK